MGGRLDEVHLGCARCGHTFPLSAQEAERDRTLVLEEAQRVAGFYPSLKTAGVPHPVPFDLFNPFGFSNKGATEEQLARRRAVEINNGRAAMIGIMGFVSGELPRLCRDASLRAALSWD